jgi:phosphomannomutase
MGVLMLVKGFKWLGNRSLQLREEGVDVLFAYEEALGYCAGSMRR